MNEFETPTLKVKNLSKQFGAGCLHCRGDEGKLKKNYCPRCATVYSCRNLSFELFPAEILGIVGESGSGKSTLMRCLYFDQEASGGEVYLQAHKQGEVNVLAETAQQKRLIRNHILGMVYQNPLYGLKMNISAAGNIAEKMLAAGHRRTDIMLDRGTELLARVNIPHWRMKEAPANFSGGMQQRVQIAKALSNNPPLLLLDEVTTGLDLSVQANVLDLIREIQRELKISMLVVSHDLAVIRMLADRTMVMLDGKVVEAGLTDQIMEDPQHPYTQELVYSLL